MFQLCSDTALYRCCCWRRKVWQSSMLQHQPVQLHLDCAMVLHKQCVDYHLMEPRNSHFLFIYCTWSMESVLHHSISNSSHWIHCCQFYRALLQQKIFKWGNQLVSMIVWLPVWTDDNADYDNIWRWTDG